MFQHLHAPMVLAKVHTFGKEKIAQLAPIGHQIQVIPFSNPSDVDFDLFITGPTPVRDHQKTVTRGKNLPPGNQGFCQSLFQDSLVHRLLLN